MDLLKLKAIDYRLAEDLAEILNTDSALLKELESSSFSIDAEEFLATTKAWEKRTSSSTYAIVLNNKAIGTISLNGIDLADKSAKIGYWLGSNYWNKGYMSRAFKELLIVAKECGIYVVSASIKKKNEASIKIWKKFNAIIVENDERFFPTIKLEKGRCNNG